MNIRHPGQLKKLKSQGPFWSYQPILPDFLVNWPNWQCCLTGSSKMVPKISIFSFVLGAENSLYVKSIATYAFQKIDIIVRSQSVWQGCVLSMVYICARYISCIDRFMPFIYKSKKQVCTLYSAHGLFTYSANFMSKSYLLFSLLA